MSKKNNDFNLDEIEHSSDELKNPKDNFNNLDLTIDDKLGLLNQELNTFKEIIDKTREYLLLELDSSLDKHKQIQIENENKYEELVVFLKNEDSNKILSLSEEIGRFKQIIDEKEKLIEILKNKEIEHENQLNESNNQILEFESQSSEINKIIAERDNQISDLTGRVDELNGGIAERDNQISDLTGQVEDLDEKITNIIASNDLERDKLNKEKDNEISKIIKKYEDSLKSINKDLDEFKESSSSQENQNKRLTDENNIFKMTIAEKDDQIKSLKEEIKILNSIINEKDETLNSLGGGD